MTDREKSHLSQRELSDIDGIDDIIQALGKFLEDAKFEVGKKRGEEYCVDENLPQAAGPLFTALGLKEDYEGKITNVLRIRGPNIARLTSSSADFVAVQVWGDDPTLDGIKLSPKTVVHIKRGVKIAVEEGSTVDLLYVAVKSKVKLKWGSSSSALNISSNEPPTG